MFIIKTDYTLNRKIKTLLFVKRLLAVICCWNRRILLMMRNLRSALALSVFTVQYMVNPSANLWTENAPKASLTVFKCTFLLCLQALSGPEPTNLAFSISLSLSG